MSVDDRDRVFREISALGVRDYALVGPESMTAAALAALGTVATNAAALAATSETGFTEGNIAYVQTFGRFFSWHPGQSLTPVAGSVINGPTGQWTDMGVPNAKYLAASFWAIDPANGNDENQGWGATQVAADAVPLKTLAELNRRMIGSNISGTVVFHLLGDVPTSDSIVLSNVKSFHGFGQPIFVGKKTQIGSDYTVSAYATAVPAANTGYLLTATGIGAAGNLGKLVTNAAENKWAFIQASVTADQVRLTNPNNYDAIAFSGGYSTVFTVSETVRVWNLPILQQFPFAHDCSFPYVEACHILGSSSSGLFDNTQFGTIAPFISHSLIDGVVFQGGIQGGFNGCLFALNGSNLSNGTSMYLYGCGVRGVNLLYTGGTPLWSANLDLENAQISLSDSCQAFFNDPSCSLSIFDVPNTIANGAAVFANARSSLTVFTSSSRIWGSGNSAFIYKAGRGACGAISASVSTVVTSAAHPISLAGTQYDFVGIPIADTATGSFINNGEH
jgi:hypothetical protein